LAGQAVKVTDRAEGQSSNGDGEMRNRIRDEEIQDGEKATRADRRPCRAN